MKLLVTLVLIAVCWAAGSVVYYFSYVLPRARDAERKAEMSAKEAEQTLQAERKCWEDGAKFYEIFGTANSAKGEMWDRPEFHFSKKLNTCLVHTRYVVHISDGNSNHYNEIWDIYGNKVIISGHFNRDTSVTPGNETPLAMLDDTPNYTSNKFFEEKAKLFKE